MFHTPLAREGRHQMFLRILLSSLFAAGCLFVFYLVIEADKQNRRDYRDYKAKKSLQS